MTNIERRKEPRMRPVDLISPIISHRPSRMIDISISGIALNFEAPLRPNSHITVSIPFGKEALILKARVCRCRAMLLEQPDKQGRTLGYTAGLEFSDLSATQDARLREFLATLSTLSSAQAHPDAALQSTARANRLQS